MKSNGVTSVEGGAQRRLSLGMLSESRILRVCLGRPYLLLTTSIWRSLPVSLQRLTPARRYGMHLQSLIRLRAVRRQSFGTFFLRNRPELELMRRLLEERGHGANVAISVVGCSKGAEVYSIAWVMRSARPDVRLHVHAIDISREILEYAERGVYSLTTPSGLTGPTDEISSGDAGGRTCMDQSASLCERMTAAEMEAMFDRSDDRVTVRSWLREGINWYPGNAADPKIASVVGPQDIVVANRFLCHMDPVAAERCLRNVARLVRPGGYLFVSGLDLDVRTKVALEMGWKPVTDLMREIHEGDASLTGGWPLEYWGLEPFDEDRPDWMVRYASVFQIRRTP